MDFNDCPLKVVISFILTLRLCIVSFTVNLCITFLFFIVILYDSNRDSVGRPGNNSKDVKDASPEADNENDKRYVRSGPLPTIPRENRGFEPEAYAEYSNADQSDGT